MQSIAQYRVNQIYTHCAFLKDKAVVWVIGFLSRDTFFAQEFFLNYPSLLRPEHFTCYSIQIRGFLMGKLRITSSTVG
jgi:hypothetical protein